MPHQLAVLESEKQLQVTALHSDDDSDPETLREFELEEARIKEDIIARTLEELSNPYKKDVRELYVCGTYHLLPPFALSL